MLDQVQQKNKRQFLVLFFSISLRERQNKYRFLFDH